VTFDLFLVNCGVARRGLAYGSKYHQNGLVLVQPRTALYFRFLFFLCKTGKCKVRGVAITAAQHTTVSNAAINACDVVGGTHLGYILDPMACNYDPATDVNVLCAASGGTNVTAGCVSIAQATAYNKFWYGVISISVQNTVLENKG